MNKKIPILIAIVLIGIAILYVVFSGKDTTSSTTANTSSDTVSVSKTPKTVTIKGHKIPSGDIIINQGDTVEWTNLDSFAGQTYDAHTVTSGIIDTTGAQGTAGVVPRSGSGVADGLYTESLALNDSFSYTFTEAGEYPFYITEHPTISGQGTIVVIAQ